jgi:putative colanic acid biosynthesis acetyltransferase WcaF
MLRVFGAKIGKSVVIKSKVSIKYPWKLVVGDDCWIGENVWIDNLSEVVIENNVCISQGALLICGNHNYKSSSFDLMVAPITLREGSWVGAKSIVGPGVTLESNSILSLGSVASKDLESFAIYRGNPAIKIKERTIIG